MCGARRLRECDLHCRFPSGCWAVAPALAQTRTSREDIANLAEEFRAHHDLELSATNQPRLDDSMRRTALDGSRHEHVRINDDEHDRGDRSIRRAATTDCSCLIDSESHWVVLVERAVGVHVVEQSCTCRSGNALPCRLPCDSEGVADLLPRCTRGSCSDDLLAASRVKTRERSRMVRVWDVRPAGPADAGGNR